MNHHRSLFPSFLSVVALFLVMTLASCYQQRHPAKRWSAFSEKQIDSLSFFSTHHYTNNYNFVVKSDSLTFCALIPRCLSGACRPIRSSSTKTRTSLWPISASMPNDSIDSVWVELAMDTSAFGVSREGKLLKNVMPDDPISHFISAFSDAHVIIFLVIIALFSACYRFYSIFKRKARIVHFNDITFVLVPHCFVSTSPLQPRFTPAFRLLSRRCGSISNFHPTLNPFSVPFSFGLIPCFGVVVAHWSPLRPSMIFRHQFAVGEAVLYWRRAGGSLCR